MTSKTRRRLVAAHGLLIGALVAGCTDPAKPEHGPAPVAERAASCTPEQRREALRALQAEVLAVAPRRLASLAEAIRPGGPLAGWRLSHGLVVLKSAGAVGVDNIAATDPLPQLLLYRPGPSTSPADWVDFAGEDGPYDLVGWAYIGPYAPDSPPPRRPCIEASEWFVHEAGWHLMDGGMLLTPAATAAPPPPDVPVLFWHPRAWDLHLWIGADGVPSVAFANPNARGGGVSLPAGSFLHAVDGRLVPSAAG